MSSIKNKRRRRPLQSYINAVEKLAPFDERFRELLHRSQFTPAEKSLIARKAHLPPLYTRLPDEYYKEHVKELKKFVPSLKKYGRKKKFTGAQRALVSRYVHVLRYADHLKPIKDKDKKNFKKNFYAPGVQAIQLRNTGNDAKVIPINRDLFVTSNGRTWIYWSLDRFDKQAIKKAGEEAFENIISFDIERIAKLAKKAFDRIETKRVYLWSEQGRVGEYFTTLKEFMGWLNAEYHKYRDQETWMRGLAILIGEQGERVPLEYWETGEGKDSRERELAARRKLRNKWKNKRRARKG